MFSINEYEALQVATPFYQAMAIHLQQSGTAIRDQHSAETAEFIIEPSTEVADVDYGPLSPTAQCRGTTGTNLLIIRDISLRNKYIYTGKVVVE